MRCIGKELYTNIDKYCRILEISHLLIYYFFFSFFLFLQSNTRTEIVSFTGNGGQELITTHSLRGHTRVVSDLNWHPKEPDILATCSIDTFIHIWDLRDQRKPSLSLSAVGELNKPNNKKKK